jgi:hypothetical protein
LRNRCARRFYKKTPPGPRNWWGKVAIIPENPGFTTEKRETKIWGGRAWLFVPTHPKAGADGYMLRARVRLEAKLGRPLAEDEAMCFIDGDVENDDPSNLDARECRRQDALPS